MFLYHSWQYLSYALKIAHGMCTTKTPTTLCISTRTTHRHLHVKTVNVVGGYLEVLGDFLHGSLMFIPSS